MSDDLANGAMIDIRDLTLSELRELSGDGDESCLAQAVARAIAADEEDQLHHFQSSI